VRSDQTPGGGSVPLMDHYLAFRANTIDHVIETTPNEARYFVGYVGWRQAAERARSTGPVVGHERRRRHHLPQGHRYPGKSSCSSQRIRAGPSPVLAAR
jgi:hypothetical protein